MPFCNSPSTIKGGTLDLLLDPVNQHNTNTTTHQWIRFNKTDWNLSEHDKHKARLINQLQTDNKVEVCCYHNQNSDFLRLKIYVVLTLDTLTLDQYRTNNTGSAFLELMVVVDRHADLFDDDCAPLNRVQKPTLTPFDQTINSTLLDMFINMPSPKQVNLPKQRRTFGARLFK
ncbi:unnamed protein product [Absidia cylindrospora]